MSSIIFGKVKKYVIARRAKPDVAIPSDLRDCHVASLLAMTCLGW